MNHPDNDALAALALGEPASPGAAEHARGCSVCSDAVTALRETLSTLRAPVPELVAPPRQCGMPSNDRSTPHR